MESLDLSKIEPVYQKKDPRGERPWNPQMLGALLLYGYCIGVRSSRRLEKATDEDVAFRVLTGGTHPDHSSIAEYRQARPGGARRHQDEPRSAGGHGSKQKAMSHARMKEREAELRAEIEAMLKEAGVVDASEDAIHGRDQRGDELPETLRRRQGRLRRIEEAKAALEAEAKAALEAELAERAAAKEDPPDAQPPPALREHQVRHDAAGAVEENLGERPVRRSVARSMCWTHRRTCVRPDQGCEGHPEPGRTGQFLLRGLEQVRGEWNLVCLTHNLLKLFRFTQRSALAAA